MRAAQSMGRRLPADLSIVSFDDIDTAQYLTPALTTMRVDKVGMGRMAVQLLINRLEFPDSSLVTTVLRPRLVERELGDFAAHLSAQCLTPCRPTWHTNKTS